MGDDGYLERLLQIMAPGKNDVVAWIEAYFDESEAQDETDFLAVAGYIFEKDRCLALDAEWKGILDEYKLPYFRMSSCAHGNDPFDKLDEKECDQAARRAIKAIKTHMTYGFGTSIRQTDYAKWMPPHNTVGNPYVWCCWMSLVAVRKWAERTGFDGKIAYFFEAGHKHQTEANGVMNRIFKSERFKRDYRYGTHGFVPKETNRPVQTPDILAWHGVQDYKRFLDGRPRRKDFAELLDGGQYAFVHGHQDMFEPLVALADFAKFVSELDLPRRRKGVAQGEG